MKRVQIISNSGAKAINENTVTYSKLNSPKALDDYDINIIDLRDDYLWENDENSEKAINKSNDFRSISKMINNSKRTKVVVMLPQNVYFKYYRYSTGKYRYTIPLKDMISNMIGIIGGLTDSINMCSIAFENTVTVINNEEIQAAFYFENRAFLDGKTYSNRSGKITTVLVNDIYFTTLALSNEKQIIGDLNKNGTRK